MVTGWTSPPVPACNFASEIPALIELLLRRFCIKRREHNFSPRSLCLCKKYDSYLLGKSGVLGSKHPFIAQVFIFFPFYFFPGFSPHHLKQRGERV